MPGSKRGLGTFSLNATSDTGAETHQFDAPLSVSIKYTPEQLEALGIAEADLGLFWFDEQAGRRGAWVALPSTVDPASQTVTASVDHFSAFQLSDLSQPSDAYIPSLEGWNVGLFTGGAQYRYPIEVPAGPTGI